MSNTPPGTALAEAQPKSVINDFAARLGVEPKKVLPLVRATCFRQRGGEHQQASPEQCAALIIVSNEYGLNPFVKELYAFPDKANGIIPVVSVDGWNRIANEKKVYNGHEMKLDPEWVQFDDDAKRCPASMTIIVHRTDQDFPTVHTEYLDEVYRPAFVREGKKSLGPWQSHTKRMLGHKTFIQGMRRAFGFGGIYDEDEAGRIIEGEAIREYVTDAVQSSLASRLEHVRQAALEDDTSPDAELFSETASETREPVTVYVDPETGEVLEDEAQRAPPGEEAEESDLGRRGPGDGDPFTVSDLETMIGQATELDQFPEIRDLLREFPKTTRDELTALMDKREQSIRMVRGEAQE